MISEQEIKKTKTLQTSIVEKFMSPEEFKKFKEKYAENSGMGGRPRRLTVLKEALTKTQRDALASYIYGPEGKTVSQLGRELGQSNCAMHYSARIAAMKVLYQNRKKINLKKILKVEEGGEK